MRRCRRMPAATSTNADRADTLFRPRPVIDASFAPMATCLVLPSRRTGSADERSRFGAPSPPAVAVPASYGAVTQLGRIPEGARVLNLLANFQLVELALKVYLGHCYEIVRKRVEGIIPFNLDFKSIWRHALKRLIELFVECNSNRALQRESGMNWLIDRYWGRLAFQREMPIRWVSI